MRMRRSCFYKAEGRHGSGAETEDHREDVHRCVSVRDEEGWEGEVSRAGDAVSGRDRVGADRGESGGDDQESPQCGRVAEEHEVSAGGAAEVFVQG